MTLLCLYRDASPADLLPASAAEFPGLIPRSGSSLTLSSWQPRCEEARLSTQASWSLRHGGCDSLAAAAGPDPVPAGLQEGMQHFPAWGSCSTPCLVPPALLQPSCGTPFPARSWLYRIPVHPRQAASGAAVPSRGWGLPWCGAAPGAGVCSPCWPRSLGSAGSTVAATHRAPSQCSLLQHRQWGRFITLAEGLRASWCLGCFQGFQSLLEVFQCPPSHAICGNWVPGARTRLPEPIWAGQPSWQVPLLPGTSITKGLSAFIRSTGSARCRGLGVTQEAGITLPGCLPCPHNTWAPAGPPAPPLHPGVQRARGEGQLGAPGRLPGFGGDGGFSIPGVL